MSTTTTLAPSFAISIAMARPMPRPPPVTIATLPETNPVMRSAPRFGAASFPDAVRQIDDHAQLGPLLVLAQHIALLGGGETALGREAELLGRHEFGSLVDAALEVVLLFKLA